MADAAYAILEYRASDGYFWKYRKYPATGDARAILVFIHGIQSHSGWYENSCTELSGVGGGLSGGRGSCRAGGGHPPAASGSAGASPSQGGYDVYFLDRRGSGMNQEARGDAPSFRRLLDDIAEFLAALPRSVSRGNTVVKLPVFLAGISWGGKLAVALERRHPGLVDGLILMCPGFFTKVRPPLWQRIGIIFSRLFRPRKKYPIPLNDPDFFTASPHWQQFLRDDPLRLHQAAARLLVESVRLDGYLRFCPKYVHVPVLLLLASEDRVIRNDWTRGFVEKFATPDKQVIEYAGAHHTLEFEREPNVFIGDVRGWVERHLPC